MKFMIAIQYPILSYSAFLFQVRWEMQTAVDICVAASQLPRRRTPSESEPSAALWYAFCNTPRRA